MDNLFDAIGSLFRRPVENLAPVPYVSGRNSIFGDYSEVMGDAAYNAYGSVGTLFAIVSQLGNAVASANWHLYQRTSTRDKKRRKEILNSEFMKIWDKPNDFMTGRFLRETVQQHLDLVGEGIIVLYRIGNVVMEMWPVRPDRMQPVKHDKKFLVGWIYQGPDGEKVPLAVDDVIQIKYPNPRDPYRGMGPVQTVMTDIMTAKAAAEWNASFFSNGARPGGIIKVDHRMSDAQFRQMLSRWREQHQGVSNAHRVAILENAEWVDTKFTMHDMQFVELRNLPRELIREAFAFPKPMLGTVDDVNRANAEAGKEIMAEGQTIPRLDRWKDVVNFALLPQFAGTKVLELDYDDPTPINHEAADRERNSQAVSAAALVKAGYDPAAVAEAMGLPEMAWKGIPGPPKQEGGEDSRSNPERSPTKPQTQRNRVRPLLKISH